jgi:hypothetical protein
VGYLILCFVYTIGVEQPIVFNQVLATNADADKTITALKSMEQNTDCVTIKIKI